MLDIVVLNEGWPDQDWQALAEKAVLAAFAHSDIKFETSAEKTVEIAIRLTGDDEVRILNAQWRGKDQPTNVLSFPMDMDGDGPGDVIMLGDVVLAHGVCTAEADDKKIALDAHATHLIVHGVLHLLGFDHIEDDDATEMESIERDVMQDLGLHNPYEDEN